MAPDEIAMLAAICVRRTDRKKYIYGGSAYINRQGLGRFSYAPKMPNCGSLNPHTGLAQTYINNKAAFFDKDLKIVIRTEYPFLYGDVACSDLPKKQDKDHWEWLGGKCGRVDADYNIVVPMKYPFEKVPKRSE